MTGTAACLLPGCSWTLTGPEPAVELEARRHTGEGKLRGGPHPGHPTVTTYPSRVAAG